MTKSGDSMKAYLITTGILFGLIALAHLVRTITEWSRVAEEPWFILQGPGLGVLAAALCYWAWRLLRASARS
jgi:protein-S-isoprenylcysteine O-methyltransferase Ste14